MAHLELLAIPVDLPHSGASLGYPLTYKRFEVGGQRMCNSTCLCGHVILVVEGEAGSFPLELQAAFERVGAETLLARSPAQARDHASRFDFSAAAIYCGDAIDTAEIRQLLDELGSMPVLLYATGPPSYVSGKAFLATSNPDNPEAIVTGVARMLSS